MRIDLNNEGLREWGKARVAYRQKTKRTKVLSCELEHFEKKILWSLFMLLFLGIAIGKLFHRERMVL